MPYPFQNNIHRLPPDVFLDCVMGIVEAQNDDRRDNFDEWIASVFGEGIADHFMRPYNFKVWAHPLETMGVNWQGDRVPTVDLRRILQNHLDDRDDVSWGPNNMFKFPLLGTGMLYERIAESLAQDGAAPQGCGSRSTRSPSASSSPTAPPRRYDELITTMPLTELVKVIDDCPR